MSSTVDVVLRVRWIVVAVMVGARMKRDRPARVRELCAHLSVLPRSQVFEDLLVRVGTAMTHVAIPLLNIAVPLRVRTKPPLSLRVPPRTVGVVTVAFALGIGLWIRAGPMLPLLLVLVSSAHARARHTRLTRRHRDRVASAVPDVIDLLRLSIDGGCTVAIALRAVANEHSGVLAPELSALDRDLAEGTGVAAALEQFIIRLGDPVRPLCAALLSSERYGLPLGAVLDSLAHEAQAARRRRTEIRARRLTITMLFPLITCILPAFAMLTVVPLLVSGLRSVHW